MKPSSFEYHAPTGVDEAVALLAELGDDAAVLAGGQSLIPGVALREVSYAHLVDLGRIDELRGITRSNGTLHVGAGTTEATIEHSAEVASAVPLLSRATPLIAHAPIRNRGTIGGSLAYAHPAAEYPAVALALDAEVEVRSTRGDRVLAASQLFTGPWRTALAPDELLVGVRFPVWTGRCGFAVDEVSSRHRDFALVGAMVAVELDDDDLVRRCAVGLFGLGPTPLRATAAEDQVTGRPVTEVAPDELGHAATDGLDAAPSDVHAPASYRRRVGAVMVARAWSTAVAEAASEVGGAARA